MVCPKIRLKKHAFMDPPPQIPLKNQQLSWTRQRQFEKPPPFMEKQKNSVKHIRLDLKPKIPLGNHPPTWTNQITFEKSTICMVKPTSWWKDTFSLKKKRRKNALGNQQPLWINGRPFGKSTIFVEKKSPWGANKFHGQIKDPLKNQTSSWRSKESV